MEKEKILKLNRYTYLDILRFVAICLVVYTHSGMFGIHSYQTVQGFKYYFYLFLVPFSQISVPLFFMISGALLLGKDDDLLYNLKHRVVRIAIATVLAIVVQYTYICITEKTAFSIIQLLQSFYGGGIITQHWYLYAYLSFLLMLPFLQKMVKAMKKRDFEYIFILACILNIAFPIFEALSDWPSNTLEISLVTGVILYPLMGYFLHNAVVKEAGEDSRTDEEKPLFTLSLKGVFQGIALIIVLAFVNLFMNNHSWVNGQKVAYLDVFTLIYSFFLFYIIKYIYENKKSTKAASLWKFLGSGVFGTYIFESVIEGIFSPYAVKIFGETGNILGLFLWIPFVVLVGILFSNLIKLIPGIKRIL